MVTKRKYRLPEGLLSGPKRRPARVADLIQTEVATLLLYSLKDPRVAGVNIVRVRVTDNLKTARLFFVCPEDEVDGAKTGLSSARGFIRSHLAKILQMRYVPELIFEYDNTLDERQRMEKIFYQIDQDKND